MRRFGLTLFSAVLLVVCSAAEKPKAPVKPKVQAEPKAADTTQPQEESAHGDESGKVDQGPPIEEMAKYLDFLSTKREIKHLSFEPLTNPVAGIESKVVIEDREILIGIADGLTYARRYASAWRRGKSSLADAILRIETIDGDQFIIGLHRSGMSFGYPYSSDTALWSAWLAKVLDKGIHQKTGKHLPKKMLDGISGQTELIEELAEFEEAEHEENKKNEGD